MYIKQYDCYKFGFKKYFLDINFVDNEYIPYCITNFLKAMYPYTTALLYEKYIEESEKSFDINTLYEVDIILDKNTHLVYIVEGYDNDYRYRIPGITKEIIIKMCKRGELNFNILYQNNFKYLFEKWVQLLQHEPKFALLYQDDKDWFDLMPFQTQEEMEQFVADHTKNKDKI
ncbi:MAG: hypothetical protein JO129_01280 [Candidatus Dependentiae bacterium]|nr:hypothetical protein [Candidatus Dependentiae bacterium]